MRMWSEALRENVGLVRVDHRKGGRHRGRADSSRTACGVDGAVSNEHRRFGRRSGWLLLLLHRYLLLCKCKPLWCGGLRSGHDCRRRKASRLQLFNRLEGVLRLGLMVNDAVCGRFRRSGRRHHSWQMNLLICNIGLVDQS